MKKLLFISLAVVLALSVGLMGCGGEQEEEEEEVWNDVIYLDMHCTISPFASIVQEVFNPWVDEAHALEGDLGGTFNITVTYGDAPFDAGASLTALTAGTVDLAQLSPDTFALGGIGYMPFLSPCIEATAYACYELWTENDGEWDANGSLTGVKILITAPLWGAQWWGNVNVTEAADFAGLDIRAEGQESTTILAFNATAVDLGTSELGNALQTGIVDGCFFTYTGWKGFSGVGPFTDYVTELNMFYRPYSLAMNLDSYNDMPSEAQAALDSISGRDASVAYATAHQAAEAEDKTETENSGKDIFYPVMTSFEDATADVATDWEAYMVGTLGFDAGIVARYEALIAAYGSCP